MNVNVWTPGPTHSAPHAFSMDVTIQWTDEEGEHEHSERVKWPQIATTMPDEWVKERIANIMIEALRYKLGID